MPPRLRSGPVGRVTDLITVGVIVLFVVLPYPEAVFRTAAPLLPVALLPAIAILFRHGWPLTVLALSLTCAIILSFTGQVSPSSLIAVAVSAFAVADLRGRIAGVIAVSTAAGAVFLSSAAPLGGDFFDARTLQFVFVIALAGALGDATRSRREFAQAMTERAERAERGRDDEARRRVAEERVRIARDLHDVVAHQISVISLSAGVASSALDARPERAREALATIRSASRTVLADIGGLMALLRSDDRGDASDLHPQTGLAGTADLIAQFADAGMPVELHDESGGALVSPASDHVAYLALREGLTNAHKHGDGAAVVVRLKRRDGALHLEIRNGLGHRGASTAGGHGLLGLRERVAAVRGDVRAERADDGFLLTVRLPVAGAA